jgi:hypothetical protein
MTDAKDALFFIKLAADQKTVLYDDIPYLIGLAITKAQCPDFDPKKDDTLTVHLKAIDYENKVRRAAEDGHLEVLNSFTWRPLEIFSESMLEGAVVRISALRKYIETINGTVEVEAATANNLYRRIETHFSSESAEARVAWRIVLFDKIKDIDSAAGGKATVREAIKWLKEYGGERITRSGESDELVWLDDMGTRQTVKKKTVSSALSEARKKGYIPV